jgi:hypothetical protein
MIMVASNCGSGPLPDPIDAGNRFRTVFDQVAEEEAGIEFLLNGAERCPIRMNVCQDKNSHSTYIPGSLAGVSELQMA